ncbi:MAG: hypothetical protein RLZ75_792 [Pseudomonadota bacterium]|jgi:hypothetical protein
MFKIKPICEECGRSEASSFSFIRETEPFKGNWKFICDCTANDEDYYIQINKFFSNPSASVDWMGHMQEKTWMNWQNFMEMMSRFRKATGSYGSL